MIKHNPSVVLGMGSFVSGPGGIAAWLLRYPLIIHEQNAIPGKTNHLLAYFANVVMESFSGSFNKRFRAVNVGNPIRKDILSIQEPSKRLIDRKGPIRLLVLGGSLGALILNQKLPKILASMSKITDLEVIHQAGEKTIDIARDEYQKYALKVKVVSYIQEMADVYNWADLVICRSGAMCVSELSAVGLPAIFIPYPSAVDNHQVANAMPLVEAGAAIIVREQEFEEREQDHADQDQHPDYRAYNLHLEPPQFRPAKRKPPALPRPARQPAQLSPKTRAKIVSTCFR